MLQPEIIYILLFGGILNTLLTLLFFGWLLLLVSEEEYIKSIISILSVICVISICSDVNILSLIYHTVITSPGMFFRCVMTYFAIGACYSIIKYYYWLRRHLKLMRDLKVQFIKTHNLGILPTDPFPEYCTNGSNTKDEWDKYLRNACDHCTGTILRQKLLPPIYQMSRISGWIGFWPISAMGLFIANPLRWISLEITNLLQSIFRYLHNRLVSKYVNLTDIE